MVDPRRFVAVAASAAAAVGGISVASAAGTSSAPPATPGVAEFHERLGSAIAAAGQRGPGAQPPARDPAKAASTADSFVGEMSPSRVRSLAGGQAPALTAPNVLVPRAEDVREILAPNALRMKGPAGQPAPVLQSNMPLAVRDADSPSGFTLADLRWTGTEGGGHRMRRSVRPVSAPASAGGSFEVGTDGEDAFRLRVADPSGSVSGTRLGEALIYPSVSRDTDVLVRGLPTGVQVAWLLRSPNAKRELRVPMQIAESSRLRQAQSGSVAIVDATGQLTATVTPPSALDADGHIVPVKTSIEGSSIVYRVEHLRGRDAYPVIVDPEFYESRWDRDAKASYAGWTNGKFPDPKQPFSFTTPDSIAAGTNTPAGFLGVFTPGGRNGTDFATNSSGTWARFAPGNPAVGELQYGRRISPEHANWTFFQAGGLSYDYDDPFLYKHFLAANADFVFAHADGSLDDSGYWSRTEKDGVPESTFEGNARDQMNNHTSGKTINSYVGDQARHDNVIAFGLSYVYGNNNIGFGNEHPAVTLNMGWYKATATDNVAPTATVGRAPTTWTNGADAVEVRGLDNGVGVKKVELRNADGSGAYGPTSIECKPDAVRICPFDTTTNDPDHGQPVNVQIPLTDLPEGDATYRAVATDAGGLTTAASPSGTADPATVRVKVDKTGPAISLGGSLFTDRDRTLVAGESRNLVIGATDGLPNGQPSDARSGVRTLVVQVDGESVAINDRPASDRQDNQGFSWDLPFTGENLQSNPGSEDTDKPTDESEPATQETAPTDEVVSEEDAVGNIGAMSLDGDSHMVAVTAIDWVGNETTVRFHTGPTVTDDEDEE